LHTGKFDGAVDFLRKNGILVSKSMQKKKVESILLPKTTIVQLLFGLEMVVMQLSMVEHIQTLELCQTLVITNLLTTK